MVSTDALIFLLLLSVWEKGETDGRGHRFEGEGRKGTSLDLFLQPAPFTG